MSSPSFEDNEKIFKLLESIKDNNVYETPSITKKCMNGVKFDSDSYFDDDGTIKWTFNRIESNSHYLDF